MLGRTHFAVGFCAGMAITTAQALTPTNAIVVTGGCILGALLPDIDQKNSMISQAVKPVGAVVSAVAGHRKLLHDPALYILAMIVLLAAAPQAFQWSIPVFIGVVTHLFLDILNPMGIPLLYLVKHGKQRLRLLKIRTGSWLDSFCCWLATAAGWAMLAMWAIERFA